MTPTPFRKNLTTARGIAAVAMTAAGIAGVWVGLLTAAESAAFRPAPAPAAYVLGPGDELRVRVLDLEEIPGDPLRIDAQGELNLPLLGRVPAAGRTVEQLEEHLAGQLSRYVIEPRVTVSLAEIRSQPVAVVGAVNHPGVQQIDGSKTLAEMLALAGGLREDAGNAIRITRRAEWGALALPGAAPDPSGAFSVAEVSVAEVLEGRRPEANIVVRAHDVIAVPRTEMVYVVGEVEKAGGFVLKERENVSVLQALALAGGLRGAAATRQARILRGGQEAARQEIAVNLREIMAGRAADPVLERDDILFVPRSGGRAAAQAARRAALSTLSGIAIWRLGSN